jgi:pimeloyl-ACP methyl ester carboxylesterase
VVSLCAHVFNEPVCVAGIGAAAEAYRQGRLRDGLARYHGERVDEVFRGWRDAWLDPAFRDWSVVAELGRIQCPVLAIQGARDPYGTVSQAEAIEGGVSGSAERLVLDDCGHDPHRDREELTLEAIRGFLR